jgi:hypothetical protein
MKNLTLKEKSYILFNKGFLRNNDRNDEGKIESRWIIYQTIPQKTGWYKKEQTTTNKISKKREK